MELESFFGSFKALVHHDTKPIFFKYLSKVANIERRELGSYSPLFTSYRNYKFAQVFIIISCSTEFEMSSILRDSFLDVKNSWSHFKLSETDYCCLVEFQCWSPVAGKFNTWFFTSDEFRTSDDNVKTAFFTSGICRMFNEILRNFRHYGFYFTTLCV